MDSLLDEASTYDSFLVIYYFLYLCCILVDNNVGLAFGHIYILVGSKISILHGIWQLS